MAGLLFAGMLLVPILRHLLVHVSLVVLVIVSFIRTACSCLLSSLPVKFLNNK